MSMQLFRCIFLFAGPRFVEIRNFDAIATWCNDFSLFSEAQKNRMQKQAKNTQPSKEWLIRNAVSTNHEAGLIFLMSHNLQH